METKEILKTTKIVLNEEEMEEINKYKESSLLKELCLTEAEIKRYYNLIVKIHDEHERCNSNPNGCCNSTNSHLHLKREGDQILITSIPCKKATEHYSKHNFHKKYWMRNFPESLLKLSLTKEYFDSIDKSKMNLIKNHLLPSLKNDQIDHGLYIYGDMGIGKTFTSIAYANDLARTGKTICFVFSPDLVYEFKQGFNEHSSVNGKIIENMKNCDVLFIDDIGAENATAWYYNENLLVVLNHRMMENKPTFFISNWDIDTLQRNISRKTIPNIDISRLIERMRGLTKNTQIHLVGENLRLKK